MLFQKEYRDDICSHFCFFQTAMMPDRALSVYILLEMSSEALVLVAVLAVFVTYFIVWTRDAPRERQNIELQITAPLPSDVSLDKSDGTLNYESHFSEADEVWSHEKSYHMYCEFYEGLDDEAIHNVENMME